MTETPSPRQRSTLVLVLVLGGFFAALLVLALSGRYTIVWKTVVIPVLVLAMALSRRLLLFIRDWAVFLSLTSLFDSVRGLIFALISRFDLPVYMSYIIVAEKWLLQGSVAPVILQAHLFQTREVGFLERFLTVVHGSHFLFFLLFGLTVWVIRRSDFYRFAAAMVALMFSGLAIYLLVPTIPPWMASSEFAALPQVVRISAMVYNMALPELYRALDTNPVAAMPSLHAAFPLLCLLVAADLYGRRCWPLVLYNLAVSFAILYLGEHYLLDVLAGWLLAMAVWFFVFRSPAVMRLAQRAVAIQGHSQLVPILVLALLFLMLGHMLGQIKRQLEAPAAPSHPARAYGLNGDHRCAPPWPLARRSLS